MAKERYYDIIVSPVYTEKANTAVESSKYSFKVFFSANKAQVKEAVEFLFGVKVEAVNIINSKPKAKVFKGVKGKRSGYKKAIVTIQSGKSIDFSAGVK